MQLVDVSAVEVELRSEMSGGPGSNSESLVNQNIVGGVFFAVGANRLQGEVVSCALVLVGLVPGIDANYLGQVTRVEVVDADGLWTAGGSRKLKLVL